MNLFHSRSTAEQAFLGKRLSDPKTMHIRRAASLFMNRILRPKTLEHTIKDPDHVGQELKGVLDEFVRGKFRYITLYSWPSHISLNATLNGILKSEENNFHIIKSDVEDGKNTYHLRVQ